MERAFTGKRDGNQIGSTEYSIETWRQRRPFRSLFNSLVVDEITALGTIYSSTAQGCPQVRNRIWPSTIISFERIRWVLQGFQQPVLSRVFPRRNLDGTGITILHALRLGLLTSTSTGRCHPTLSVISGLFHESVYYLHRILVLVEIP